METPTTAAPANVYENQTADARQSDAPTLPDDRLALLFRPRYRVLTPDEVELHDEIKTRAANLAESIFRVTEKYAAAITQSDGLQMAQPAPEQMRRLDHKSENVERALAHLEDAVYRAVKALTA